MIPVNKKTNLIISEDTIIALSSNFETVVTYKINEPLMDLTIIKNSLDHNELKEINSYILKMEEFSCFNINEDISFYSKDDKSYSAGYNEKTEEIKESYEKMNIVTEEIQQILDNVLDDNSKTQINEHFKELKTIIYTELKKMYFDPMTDLLNKPIFYKLIGNRETDKRIDIIASGINSTVTLSHANKGDFVALADLSNFKYLNDTLGHSVGDTAIIEFSKLLRQSFPNIAFARMGGDEFACVIKSDSFNLYEKLKNFMDNELGVMLEEKIPELKQLGDVKVGGSIGYTVYNSKISAENLIHAADMDMIYNKLIDKLKHGTYDRSSESYITFDIDSSLIEQIQTADLPIERKVNEMKKFINGESQHIELKSEMELIASDIQANKGKELK